MGIIFLFLILNAFRFYDHVCGERQRAVMSISLDHSTIGVDPIVEEEERIANRRLSHLFIILNAFRFYDHVGQIFFLKMKKSTFLKFNIP